MNEVDGTEFISHAKWIMAGEHTVVRGGKALAFPLERLSSILNYNPSSKLEISENDAKFEGVFRNLLERAANFCNVSFEKISGVFKVKSNIVTGAGLGSSAAICANVARVFRHLGFCDDADVFKLATYLEDMLHGKSSGLDVSVAIANKGVVFQKNQVVRTIDPPSWPHMLLTFSGEKASTSQCADVVRSLRLENPEKAAQIDALMNEGADLCESGLERESFADLRDGIMACDEAFRGWGLYSDALAAHTDALKSAGAVATKPVGSGLGGFVLSLWEDSSYYYKNSNKSYQSEITYEASARIGEEI